MQFATFYHFEEAITGPLEQAEKKNHVVKPHAFAKLLQDIEKGNPNAQSALGQEYLHDGRVKHSDQDVLQGLTKLLS
ncbi:MAG: hypothetical protein H0W64_04970 [Gammaproteobacteria bacterium]|nr:hypothetical protein [Gammaproteobacteria bacterium]